MVIFKSILAILCIGVLANLVYDRYIWRKKVNEELCAMYLHALGMYIGSKKDVYVLHDVGFYEHMAELERFVVENYRKHPNNLSLFEIGEWIEENNFCK